MPLNEERLRQFPPIAKQPALRLMPPVDEKVEVAVEKLMPFVFPIEKIEPGEVVPTPTLPVDVMDNAEVVAKVSLIDPRFKVPLAYVRPKCFCPTPAELSVKTSWLLKAEKFEEDAIST